MIKLFPKDATDFTTNGIKILQPTECVVSEVINDDYSLKITMPKSDVRSPGSANIQPEMIIKAPTPSGEQLFRVYLPDVDALGSNTYYARHIFYDLLDQFIEDTRSSGDGPLALGKILEGTGFTSSSDIAVIDTAYYEMMSPVFALLGADNAFISRWGGEIERNNFSVNMWQRRGSDKNVSIRYKKNLTGLTVKTDVSSVITRIYPTGRQEDGQILLKLPEKYIDSPLIGHYVHPKIARMDYQEIQTEAELRAAAQAEWNGILDKPSISADVQFVSLEKTNEYADFAALEKIYIGDTVHIFHEPLGMDFQLRAVAYEYDCILEKYNRLTLGKVSPIIGSAGSVVGQLAQSAAEQQIATYDNSVKQLTALMANALGYYQTSVKQIDGSNIDYMHDQPTLGTSKVIWKKTINGFAVSVDGGITYGAGFTADGNIIAKILTVIGINAQWITAGKLQSKDGNVYFDLDNNELAVERLESAKHPGTYMIIGRSTVGSNSYPAIGLQADSDTSFIQIRKMSADNSVELISPGNMQLYAQGSMSLSAAGVVNLMGTVYAENINCNGFHGTYYNDEDLDANGYSLKNVDAIYCSSATLTIFTNGANRGCFDSGGWEGWVNGNDLSGGVSTETAVMHWNGINARHLEYYNGLFIGSYDT